MIALTFPVRPWTAFATPIKGDTLFGQLCWAIRHGWGEARLGQLLDGYTAGRPFAVIADAFPAGYLPLPALPASTWTDQPVATDARKALKRKVWIPVSGVGERLETWRGEAVDAKAAGGGIESRPQARNSLNRLTGTTGEGFSPYSVPQIWYAGDARLELHVCLDESRLPRVELANALAYIGQTGYGKDASTGLGKFRLDSCEESRIIPHQEANAWLTLAPCAPQGLEWKPDRCFYRPFTRHGRHGDLAVYLGNPFKSPLLLADTGAILTPAAYCGTLFTGQGLGGEGSLSAVLPQTVHQGYAPVIGVRLQERAHEVS